MPALKEAKQRAKERSQPLLLEFTSDNCVECDRAAELTASDTTVLAALARVSFLRIDAKSEEGKRLAKKYLIGVRLPAYILTDSEGKEISRWTSFAAPQPFVRQLSRATRDLTPVETRLERMKSAPSLGDALALAGYYMSIKEPAKGAEYFRKADLLNEGSKRDNYKFQIFDAMANAVWFGQAEFAEAEKAADDVINSGFRPKIDPVRVASELGDLARKTGHTDRMEKYLRIAIEKMGPPSDENTTRIQTSLKAELLLYGDHDTAQAIETKKSTLGPAFRRTTLDEFDFADWCANRGINLDQAEATMNRFLESGPPPGRPISILYQALSRIARVRGDHEGALANAQKAVESDPQNTILADYLKELQEK
ncbi:MAG: thioredoxin family protein [candidate division Zixibacteria bacterium]|nr:thioredoxin family protein [candidate division Zixibacteria bacterium]